MTVGSSSINYCVACGLKDWCLAEKWVGFQLATCSNCGLTFTLNPNYRPEHYKAAYEGGGDLPVPEEHAYVYSAPAKRLCLESLAFAVPPPRLTPAEHVALRLLKQHAPKGATVIDCGCGSGRFLRVLQRVGFHPVGMEISRSIVELLIRAGLEAIQGKAPDFFWEGSPPFAITFFEVLEHLPDPIQVIRPLRERFPETFILASVPSPQRAGLLLKGERGLSDYPPNHFLRWTPEALRVFFLRAGYAEVEVILPKPIGSEMLPGLGQLLFRSFRVGGKQAAFMSISSSQGHSRALLERVKATLLLWGHRTYQMGMDLLGAPKAFLAREKGASAASMLVIAKP